MGVLCRFLHRLTFGTNQIAALHIQPNYTNGNIETDIELKMKPDTISFTYKLIYYDSILKHRTRHYWEINMEMTDYCHCPLEYFYSKNEKPIPDWVYQQQAKLLPKDEVSCTAYCYD